jgi:hypothetical protein
MTRSQRTLTGLLATALAVRSLFRGRSLFAPGVVTFLLLLTATSSVQAQCSFVSVTGTGFYKWVGTTAYVLPPGGDGALVFNFTGAGCNWEVFFENGDVNGVTVPNISSGTSTGTQVIYPISIASDVVSGLGNYSRSASWQLYANGAIVGEFAFYQNVSACTATISPAAVSLGASGGSGTFSLNVTDYCWYDYTLSPSGQNWLGISISTTSGIYQLTGASPTFFYGTMNYTAAPNATTVPQSASLNVIQPSAATFTVNEAAGTATQSVTLVATPPSITVNSLVNGPNIVETINFTSSSATTPVNITNITDEASAYWDYGLWFPGPTPSTMTLTFFPSGLSVGTYNDTFVVTSSASNSPLQIPVTLNIVSSSETGNGPPALGVNPSTPISAGVTIGTNAQMIGSSINLTSSNSTPVDFAVFTQTNNLVGGNWLSVSLGSGSSSSVTGSTPATLTVYANMQGFVAGVYTGTVTITPQSSSSSGPTTINVTVTASGTDQLSITWAPGNNSTMAFVSPLATVGFIQVDSSVSGQPLSFNAVPTIMSPAGGTWLTVNESSPQTNATVTVTAQAGGLSTGVYQAAINVYDSANVDEQTINVTLTIQGSNVTLIASPASVAVTSPEFGPNIVIPINFTSSSSSTPVAITSITDNLSVNWDLGVWATGNTPSSMTLTLFPASLSQGTYSDSFLVTSNASNNPLSIPVQLTVGPPQPLTISHVADGGGWTSTLLLVNRDTVTAPYTVNLWSDSGGTFAPPLVEGATSGAIPVGGSVLIRTADANPTLTEGWAQVVSNQAIGGTAIFKAVGYGQEAGVPLLTSGGKQLDIPYEAGNGLALGVALANPSTAQAATVVETIRDQNGNQLSQRTLMLQPQNHTAFNPPALNGLSGIGVVEYDSDINIFGLGIRSSGEAFTSIDAIAPQPALTKTISHIADGGGWRSTLILVNTDTVPANYTVNFWGDNGSSFTPDLSVGATTGTIPIGGTVLLRTADLNPSLIEGWAEVVSSQSIDGTAIFRADGYSQEAAVPLLTSAGTSLELPYEAGNGLSLGVALVNPSTNQDATVQETVRDENGNVLSSRQIDLPAHCHTAFNPPALAGIVGQGVVEYDANTIVYALGIRGANEAFTSEEAIYK